MTVVELDRVETPPRDQLLVHIAETCCPPFVRTLCGERLDPTDSRTFNAALSEVCVVCLELDRAQRTCAGCGATVGHRWADHGVA